MAYKVEFLSEAAQEFEALDGALESMREQRFECADRFRGCALTA